VPSYEQQLLLQRLFQGDTNWIQVLYLAGMFSVLFWRRESVLNWWLFRISYVLYGVSLVAPYVARPLAKPLGQSRTSDGQFVTYIIVNALGPSFLAAAIICGMGSMTPRLVPGTTACSSAETPLD
jgi:hypothetical protein